MISLANKENIHKLFIFTSLIIGMIMVVITPPFQTPDEDSHFKKAYVMAYGDFIPTIKNGKLGFYISKSMVDDINDKISIIGNRDEKVSYSELILDDRLPSDYGDKDFVTFSTAGSVPIAHIIPAIGIFIGRILAKITQGGYASITYLIYFARFANLIFYTAMVGIAIKISPVLKKTMLAIGIMPMTIYLAASVSYDCLINACVILSTAIIFKLLFDNTYILSYYNMTALAVLAACILLIKPNYVLIFLLLFFIPQSKFADIKEYLKKAGLFLLLIIGVYFIFRLPLYFVSGNLEASESLAGQQLNYILANPLSFFKATYKTICDNINFFVAGTVGLFGLIDTYLPSFVTYLYLFLVIIIGLSDAFTSDIVMGKCLRIAMLVVPMISILLIFFAMYWTWTPNQLGVGADTVSGVQGRYFIPMMIMPFLFFQNKKIARIKTVNKLNKLIDCYAFSIIKAVLIISCIFIFLRFWV